MRSTADTAGAVYRAHGILYDRSAPGYFPCASSRVMGVVRIRVRVIVSNLIGSGFRWQMENSTWHVHLSVP